MACSLGWPLTRCWVPGGWMAWARSGSLASDDRRAESLGWEIGQLNPAMRGWCAYFRPGVSAAAFADLARYTLDPIMRWARRVSSAPSRSHGWQCPWTCLLV